jgi:hypothetical protein
MDQIPAIVGPAAFQAELDGLGAREKGTHPRG